MDKLFAWLRVEPKGWALLSLFAIVLMTDLVYLFLMGNILESAGITLRERSDVLVSLRETPIFFLGIVLPFSAMLEETFFRLPLLLLPKRQPWIMLTGAVLLSVYFGYMHGGWQQIPIQGFGGLLFCVVFLKCGGLQERPWKAFFSSSFVHLASNWLIIAIVLSKTTHTLL